MQHASIVSLILNIRIQYADMRDLHASESSTKPIEIRSLYV